QDVQHFLPGYGGNSLTRFCWPARLLSRSPLQDGWDRRREGTGPGFLDDFSAVQLIHGNHSYRACCFAGNSSSVRSSWDRARATKTSSRLGSVACTSTPSRPRSTRERLAFTST